MDGGSEHLLGTVRWWVTEYNRSDWFGLHGVGLSVDSKHWLGRWHWRSLAWIVVERA
jgi:hypothetical protein